MLSGVRGDAKLNFNSPNAENTFSVDLGAYSMMAHLDATPTSIRQEARGPSEPAGEGLQFVIRPFPGRLSTMQIR